MPSGETESSIHFVIGSTSDVPFEWAQEHGIGIVPAVITFGEEVFIDTPAFSMEAFLKKLKESKIFPTTAAPNPEIYKPFYEYQGPIISIHAGDGFSSFWANSVAAKVNLNRENIFPYNTQSVSFGEGFFVLEAQRLKEEGATVPDIIRVLDKMRPRTHVIALCDTLEYLKRGGRVSRGQAILGSLLNIKPTVHVYNNEIVPLDKARTHGKAVEQLVTRVHEFGKLERLVIIHSGNLEWAKELAYALRNEFDTAHVLITLVTKGVAAHAGPNAVGVAFVTAA